MFLGGGASKGHLSLGSAARLMRLIAYDTHVYGYFVAVVVVVVLLLSLVLVLELVLLSAFLASPLELVSAFLASPLELVSVSVFLFSPSELAVGELQLPLWSVL